MDGRKAGSNFQHFVHMAHHVSVGRLWYLSIRAVWSTSHRNSSHNSVPHGDTMKGHLPGEEFLSNTPIRLSMGD